MSYRKWTFRVGALLGLIGVCGLGVVAGVAWSQAERQRTYRQQTLSQTPGSYAGYPLSSVSANQAANSRNSSLPSSTPLPPYPGKQPPGVLGPIPGVPVVGPGGWIVQNSGMGGMGGDLPETSGTDSAVTWWVKPQGEEPGWLSRGKQAIKAEETLREALNKDVSVDIANTELLAALEVILGEHKIPYLANPGGMDAPLVSLNAQGSLRDVLRRLLRPMQLDYVIHRDSVQIVNPREDSFDRTIRVYDLAHVINNSQDMDKVLQLIESTLQPDQWHNQGGQSRLESVGSVLAVAGTELLHEEVETLLAKLDSLGLQSKTGLQGASNQTVEYSSMYRAGLVPATPPLRCNLGMVLPVSFLERSSS